MQYLHHRSILLLTKILFLFSLLQLTGCAPTVTSYILSSNPTDAKVYRGDSPDSLSYYKNTYYGQQTTGSFGWSNNYFQARKEGYKDSEIYRQPMIGLGGTIRIHFNLEEDGGETALAPYQRRNTLQAYYEFLGQYPESTLKPKVFGLMMTVIASGLSPNKEYDRLADKYPESVKHMPESVRLNYVGPVGMRVSDIRSLIKQGIGGAILEQKILSAGEPYAEFSFSEIKKLTSMGMTDKIIAAMLKVTKEYEDKEKERKLAAQKSQQNSRRQARSSMQAAPAAQSGGSQVGDKLAECATLIAKKKACDQIGGFGGMACMAMIPGGHNCF